MSRFLFVAPPIASHVRPASAVSQALRARGEEVAWAGSERFLRPLLGDGVTVYPTGIRLYRDLRAVDGTAARAFLVEYVAPLACFVLRAVEEAVAAFEPDVLVADQHAIAGALVAYRRGLPWASLLPGSSGLLDLATRSSEVDAWLDGTLAALAPDVPADRRSWLLYSPHLRIAFTTLALTGPLDLDDTTVLTGPALGERPDDPPFDLGRLDPARHTVLVTVGTLNVEISADFYARVAEALAPLGDRVQAIVVAPPGVLADPPGHILVAPQVPMLALMPHVQAVVGHGGMNTAGEALAHGTPLVVAPITLDQPTTAAQVAACGAGIRVDFDKATPDELRAAILAVLEEPSYRDAAHRIRESFRAAGGAAAAAEHLQRLAHRG